MIKKLNTLIILMLMAINCYGDVSLGRSFEGNKEQIVLGDTSESTTYWTAYNGNVITSFFARETPTKNAKIKRAYVRFRGSDTDNKRFSLYDSSDNLVAYTDDITETIEGWNVFYFTGSQQVVVSTSETYLATIHSESTYTMYNDQSSGAHSNNAHVFADGAPATKDWVNWNSTGGGLDYYIIGEPQ